MRSCQHLLCVPSLAGSPFVYLFFSEKISFVKGTIHGVPLGSKERFFSTSFMGMEQEFLLSRKLISRVICRTHSDSIFLFLPYPIGREIFFYLLPHGYCYRIQAFLLFSGLRPCFFLPPFVFCGYVGLVGLAHL